MNSNTRTDLQEFIRAMKSMAMACYTLIGEEQARNVIEAGDQLIQQLDKDETII